MISSIAVAHSTAFSAAVSAAVFSLAAAHAARPAVGLGVLDLPVVEVVLAAEVALPHAVVLVASAVVLDAVKVGGLRYISIRHHKHMVGLLFFRRRQSAGNPVGVRTQILR